MAVGEMYATHSRPRGSVVADRIFSAPVWMLGLATLAAATLVHGYHGSTALHATTAVAADPFTQNPDIGAWMYQTPVGPIIAHYLGLTLPAGVMFVDYVLTSLAIFGATLAVARWATDYAARLFLFAYFCSPQSWAGTAYLGMFDLLTVAGITVLAVAPAAVCFPVAVLVGVNHFEQGGIALVAVAVIRLVIRRERSASMVAAFAGLALGKALLLTYMLTNGIDTNGRLDFIRDTGLADIVGGWRGHETVLLWAVFNVLWVGVIWMAATMPRRDRCITVGLFAMLTMPVLITYDLSRVYRTVTWPLVMLLVLYASEWPNRRLVQRAAIMLAVVAVFAPRTELYHGGVLLN